MAKLELLSRTIYDADGVQTNWDFNFASGYLLPEHVKAYYELGNVRTQVTVVPAMLIGPNQLRIAPAVPAGAVLTIYRDTPKNAPLVDFVDRGTISEVSLDTVAKQAIFAAAEAADSANTASTDVAVSAAASAAASALASEVAADAAANSAVAAAASAAEASVSVGAVDAHKATLAAPAGAGLIGYAPATGPATTVAARLLAHDTALGNVEGNLNFTTLPSATLPIANADLLLVRQGTTNKKAAVSDVIAGAVAASVSAVAPSVTAAQAARDAAFVNAAVYATTAAGLAATTAGQQFQVVSGNEIIRYRHDTGPIAVEVARYPAAAPVQEATRKLAGLVEATPNLLNTADAEVANGFFVNHTTGNLQSNVDYWTSGFTPVVAGQAYYLGPKTFLAWYTAAKVYISGSSNGDTNPVQTAPANAAFLRSSIHFLSGHTVDKSYIVAGSEPLSVYQPYGGKLSADPRRLPDGLVTPTKTSFLFSGKNLFDKATRTLDSIQSTSGIGTSTSFDLSAPIPVEEGKTYQYRSAAGGARFRACFNSVGVNVTAQSSTAETSSYTVPAGSGVTSMRLSIAKARIDDFQVEVGAAPTAFEPFGFYFVPSIQVRGTTVSTWSGLSWTSYGDSITAQTEWQPKVAAKLGLVHTALGVGGRQIAGATGMCQDAAVDTIPTSTQLLVVLGGTNDWAQSRVLGAVTSTNTEEFYGALNQMAQKLTTRLPTCRIVLATTPYGELPGRLTDGVNWLTAETNLAGLTTRAYAEAIRVAGKRWGFPVIDFDESGWNELNLATYMKADGGRIHPNTAGGTRMAEVVIGRLRDLEPV